jgi:hypothetical protein
MCERQNIEKNGIFKRLLENNQEYEVLMENTTFDLCLTVHHQCRQNNIEKPTRCNKYLLQLVGFSILLCLRKYDFRYWFWSKLICLYIKLKYSL